jgi:hypothetical protein
MRNLRLEIIFGCVGTVGLEQYYKYLVCSTVRTVLILNRVSVQY